MYKAILQLTYTVHRQSAAGTEPSYNKTGKAIATLDGVSEDDCLRQVDEFILKNDMVMLEKRAKL